VSLTKTWPSYLELIESSFKLDLGCFEFLLPLFGSMEGSGGLLLLALSVLQRSVDLIEHLLGLPDLLLVALDCRAEYRDGKRLFSERRCGQRRGRWCVPALTRACQSTLYLNERM